MEAKSIVVEPRTDAGKNESRRVRKSGFIPGVLYSHGKTESIKINEKDFFKLFKGKISESIIFDIHGSSQKDTEERMAYVKDYQMDPVTNKIVHIDLFKVTATEKITTHVPIVFTGTAAGIKMGGILEVEVREIVVECLPKDLPEKVQVDVSSLNTGDAIHVRDIDLGEKVRIVSNPEGVITTVVIPKIAVVEEKVEEAAAVAEGEAGEEAKGDEDASKSKDAPKSKEKEASKSKEKE